jgi:mevalonate kinase
MLIQRLKDLPDVWLLCLTILFFPLAVGLSVKIASTPFVSFSNGNTQIQLGEVAQESDRLIEQLEGQNQALIEASSKLSQAARRKKIKLPELEEVQEAIETSEDLTDDLKANNQELQNLSDVEPSSESSTY